MSWDSSVVVEMIRFRVTRFAVWWKRVVFSFVIGDSLFAVVKTNGALTVDVATLDGHEVGTDIGDLKDEGLVGASEFFAGFACMFHRGKGISGGGLWQGGDGSLGGGRGGRGESGDHKDRRYEGRED